LGLIAAERLSLGIGGSKLLIFGFYRQLTERCAVAAKLIAEEEDAGCVRSAKVFRLSNRSSPRKRLSSTELPNKGLLIVNFLPWAMVLLLSADLLDVEEAFPDIRKVNASLRANDGPFDNRQGVLERRTGADLLDVAALVDVLDEVEVFVAADLLDTDEHRRCPASYRGTMANPRKSRAAMNIRFLEGD
jgi:hypothetical protein